MADGELGIYMSLEMKTGGQLRRYVHDIPPHIGDPVDADRLHVTLMYPEELANARLGSHEKAQLPNVQRHILKAIGSRGLYNYELPFIGYDLVPFKQFMAVLLDDPDGIIATIREKSVAVIKDLLNIKLDTYLPAIHMAVARRTGGSDARITHRRHRPQSVAIRGLDTGIHLVTHNQPQNQSYVRETRGRGRLSSFAMAQSGSSFTQPR